MNNTELDIITPTKFSLLIEQMVQTKKITYMDACLEYCKDKEIEPNSILFVKLYFSLSIVTLYSKKSQKSSLFLIIAKIFNCSY